MAAPIRKVAPNGFSLDTLAANLKADSQLVAELASKPIHDSLSVFGVVVSSTAPGSLHRAAVARGQLRRLAGLR